MPKILSGIMGLCIGDAVGVPVEFKSREFMNKKPVKDMIGYGTYNLPAGTWSDDSSLTLCLVDSLSNTLNYNDIMDKFVLWFKNAEYTPYGKVFDVGNTTRYSIMNYINGVFPLECGGKNEQDNGNGSLMRILPIAFYLDSLRNNERKNIEQIMQIIHNVSSLTHGHSISKIACGIYTLIAIELIAGHDIFESINKGVKNAFNYYNNNETYKDTFIIMKDLAI